MSNKMQDTIKLSGFNNLTKILSFNFYDFCIAMNEQQKQDYINHIHTKYCAKNISEIAFELGFEHPSHFTKIFKSKTGKSPSDYRHLN